MERLTSDHSAGTQDPGPRWIKSSRSFYHSNCVEAAVLPDGQIGVRDSKNADGPVLRFTPREWRAFLRGARNGELDRPGDERR